MVRTVIELSMKTTAYWSSRLYDFYPEDNEVLLIDTMKLLKASGDPWESVFKEEVGLAYYHTNA